MPGWNIHLEVGERVADRIKLFDKKREEFLLGCLLPDINNGYVNKVKTLRRHSETHWAFDEKSSLNFFEKYEKEIRKKEPVFVGYLLHLYTDGYFNYHFYHHVKRTQIGEGLDHEEKQKIKHNDFWIYDTKFANRELKFSDEEEVAKKANQIDKVDVDESEIKDVTNIVNGKYFAEQAKGRKYQFYTERWLDELMDEMIESFLARYNFLEK